MYVFFITKFLLVTFEFYMSDFISVCPNFYQWPSFNTFSLLQTNLNVLRVPPVTATWMLVCIFMYMYNVIMYLSHSWPKAFGFYIFLYSFIYIYLAYLKRIHSRKIYCIITTNRIIRGESNSINDFRRPFTTLQRKPNSK